MRPDRRTARWALIRAARYLNAGGSREAVAGYVNEWLDYWLELDLRDLVDGPLR